MASAVHFEGDLMPGITIVGHDLTPRQTAYGVLADIISVRCAAASRGAGKQRGRPAPVGAAGLVVLLSQTTRAREDSNL